MHLLQLRWEADGGGRARSDVPASGGRRRGQAHIQLRTSMFLSSAPQSQKCPRVGTKVMLPTLLRHWGFQGCPAARTGIGRGVTRDPSVELGASPLPVPGGPSRPAFDQGPPHKGHCSSVLPQEHDRQVCDLRSVPDGTCQSPGAFCIPGTQRSSRVS